MKSISIENIYLHVTKTCNLKCAYCYFFAGLPIPNELTAAELKKIWIDIVALKPKKLILTGGEPLLHPNIIEIIKDLEKIDKNHSIYRCLNTNGHLVTKELAKNLVGLVDEIRVSLDALKEKNDAIRGLGNYDAAMRALEHFYSVGFEPKVMVTVTSKTIEDLPKLLSLLYEMDINRIKINAFRPIGRGITKREWTTANEEIRAAILTAKKNYTPNSIYHNDQASVHEEYINCGVGSHLNIMPDGDVFPCHVLIDRNFRLGNLRKQSILEICKHNGVLSQLQSLNFHDLAQQDIRFKPLVRGCLGAVYKRNTSLPLWKTGVSLFQSLEPGRVRIVAG